MFRSRDYGSIGEIAFLILCALFIVCAAVDFAHAATPNGDAPYGCKSRGQSVTLEDARMAPDRTYRLPARTARTIPFSVALRGTETHAYVTGSATRQWSCVRRSGVDIFDAWTDASGRIVATFDGRTIRSKHKRVTFALWYS